MKFPHFIRSQKRLPDSGLQDWDMRWDFWTLQPESAHQVTYLMGDRGIPRSWREMNGYGSHTYLWVNAAGERSWVKYHFHSAQGVHNLTNDEAALTAATDPDAHRRDLFNAIKDGDFPSWTLSVQVMPYEDAKTYPVNPFDLTKIWSHEDYPLIKVGTMTLNRNPENFFAQIEQAAFEPSAVVPGIGFSPDKMLLGRVFAYADTHRYRIGPNYLQLPVNRPKVPVNSYEFDGPMRYEFNPGQPVVLAQHRGWPGRARRPVLRSQLGERRRHGPSGVHAAARGRRLQPGERAGQPGDGPGRAGPAGGDRRLDPGDRPSRHPRAGVRRTGATWTRPSATPSPTWSTARRSSRTVRPRPVRTRTPR